MEAAKSVTVSAAVDSQTINVSATLTCSGSVTLPIRRRSKSAGTPDLRRGDGRPRAMTALLWPGRLGAFWLRQGGVGR